MDIFPPPNLCVIHQNEIFTVKKVAAAFSKPSEQTTTLVGVNPKYRPLRCQFVAIVVRCTNQLLRTSLACNVMLYPLELRRRNSCGLSSSLMAQWRQRFGADCNSFYWRFRKPMIIKSHPLSGVNETSSSTLKCLCSYLCNVMKVISSCVLSDHR